MNVTTYKVEAMTCGHCVSTVKAAVGSVVGVTAVDVDLRAGTVITTGTYADSAVAEAISKAGYEVVATEPEATAGSLLPLVGKSGGCCCG
ncbi:heavy-metal-associated domain-containing protein [Antrihabitans spumae]|uniref:Heavy-metal-associated domain-containing protein n=1 Tax=Antrihabitans spumae TaxID=3373370 RepID=A0ABW7KPX7_9NOCA